MHHYIPNEPHHSRDILLIVVQDQQTILKAWDLLHKSNTHDKEHLDKWAILLGSSTMSLFNRGYRLRDHIGRNIRTLLHALMSSFNMDGFTRVNKLVFESRRTEK